MKVRWCSTDGGVTVRIAMMVEPTRLTSNRRGHLLLVKDE
jgi:hypothetical protein